MLVIIVLMIVVCGFDMERRAKLADAAGRPDGLYGLPAAGIRVLAIRILNGGVVIALLATVIGSRAVKTAETRDMRPSGFAKVAAGLATMMLGGAMGVLAAVFLAVYKKPVTAVPAAPTEALELSWVSYAVLAGMLTLIVVGLAWCFYRAIKAAGGKVEIEQQTPEGISQG